MKNDSLNILERDENNKVEDWLNDHGHPNYAYLQSLVSDNSVEALETLKAIATDLDVDYHENISAGELMERIRMVINQNEDDNNLHIIS